ncbi:MAG: Clp protease N-terminal domain-containing protein, partial [Comamonas sp.]
MRIDKLTTKFQEALADAQSLALGADQSTIDPLHLLVAMLRQPDGPSALLQRAGCNVQQLKSSAEKAMADLPRVQQQGDVQVGSELARLLQATDKEAMKRGDQFIASELFLLALADGAGSSSRAGALLKESGVSRSSLESAIDAVRGGQNVDSA